ncbi:hypothetical protein, partial [Streptomyces hygroscopicus]
MGAATRERMGALKAGALKGAKGRTTNGGYRRLPRRAPPPGPSAAPCRARAPRGAVLRAVRCRAGSCV